MKALTRLDEILSHPEDIRLWKKKALVEKANIYREREEFAKAAETYELLLSSSPEKSQERYEFERLKVFQKVAEAHRLQQSGDVKVAAKAFRVLLTQYPDSVEGHRGYIQSKVALKKYEELESFYKSELKKKEGSAVLEYALGLTLTYAKPPKIKEAIRHLENAVNKDQSVAYFHQTLGWAYEQYEKFGKKRGFLEKAIGEYMAALELNDVLEFPDVEGNLLLNTGNSWFALGNFFQAFRFYSQRETFPQQFPSKTTEMLFRKNFGETCFKTGRSTCAVDQFQKAIALLGKGENALLQKAELLERIGLAFQDIEKYSKAVHYFSHALEIALQLGLKKNISLLQRNIGVNLYNMSLAPKEIERKHLIQALNHYLRAIQLVGKYGVKEQKKGKGLINIDTGLGEKTSTHARGFDKEGEEKLLFGYIANTYEKLSETESSIKYYMKKISRFPKTLSPEENAALLSEKGVLLNRMGLLNYSAGNVEKAKEDLLSSLHICVSLGLKRGARINLFNISKIFAQLLFLEKETNPEEVLSFLRISRDFFSSESESSRDFYIFSNLALLAYISYTPPQEASSEPITDDFVKQFYDQYRFLGDALYFYKRAISGVKQDEALPSGQKTNLLMHLNLNLLAIYQQNGLDELALQTRVELEAAKKAGNALSGWVYTFFQSKKAPPKLRANLLKEAADTLLKTPLPVKKKGEVLQFLPLLKALKTDLVENLVEGGKVYEAFSYLEKLDKRIVTLKLFHELGEDVFFQGISGEYSVELRAILDEWKTGIKNGEGKKILELEPLFEETIFSLYDENPSSVSLLFQYDPPVQNLSKVITEEGAYLKIMEGKKGFHFFLLKNRKFSYVNLSKKQNKTLDIGEFSSSLSETSSIYVSGPQKILKRVRDEYLQEKSITHVNNFYNILDAHQRRNLFVSKGFSTGKFTLDNNLVDEDLFPPVKTLRKDFVTNKDLFTDSNFFVGTLPLNSTAGYRFKEKEGLHRTLRLSDISPVYGHTAFLLNIPKAQKKHVDIWVESLLKTGFAHVVINNSPFSKANAEKFVSLYLSYIADLPAAEALAVAQQDISEWAGERADFSLYGYSGMDEEEKKTLASRTYLKELENAVTHFKKKAYGSALKGFENALRVSKIAGKEGDTKKLLTLLVESAFKTGDYHTAILFQKRLVSLSKSDDPAEKANAAFTLGTLYSRAGNYDRAVVLIEDAITFWKKNDELDELAKGASTLGIVRENMGEYSAAFQQFSSTSELFQELGEGTGVAEMYRKMGRINYLRRGRYEEARKNFEFANGVYLELNNVKGVVETYFEIGFTYEKMGLFEKADRFYTKGINLSKTLPEQTLMAKGKLYLGNTNWFRGEYQKSFSYLSEAEELAHQKDTAFQIMAENTKGLIFWTLNEPKKALTHVNKAISFSRTQKISSELATSLNNAGLIYRQSGKIEKSIEMFQKALEIDTSLKNKWGLGYDHRNLGISQMRLKHYEKAEKHLTLAETMSEEIKNRPNHVKSLLELGNLNLETGKTEKALSFYQNAYEASVKYYLKEVSWRAAYKQGIIQKKKGNLEEALKWFKTAISIVEKMRAGIKIEELQNSFQENKISLYKDAIVLLVNMGQTDAAFNYVERSRSRSFIDLLGNKKITVKNNSDQKELEKVQSLFLKIETITRELGAYDSPPKKLLEKLEENKTRYEEALIEIKRKNPQLSSFVSVEPLTLEELKDILDEKLGALTYMLTDDEVLIWLITKKKTLFFRSRTELSETTKLVKQYRTGIQNLEPVDNELKRLYQILIEPVAKEIDQLENLAIIPDGALHYLSFSALNKGDGYLIDKIPLFYLPSASVFKFTFAKRTNKTFEKVKVLAVGNPDLGSFNYDLPMAELEAGSIKWTFPEVDLLTREKATEKWIVDNIDKYNIIHIASHGEFNTLDPLLSALMFASESSEPASLTVQEIFSLNLKADIVTLSACQTGLGKLKAGELIGLNRAFMYAGTHSLISSLWRVDDLSTALLMKYFYRFLPQHDKGSSLRKAQLLVKKNFPHPAYWSGFSLVGDYR
ncbi:MAG: CHAT domain-containing protein [Nitrospinota bacterium]